MVKILKIKIMWGFINRLSCLPTSVLLNVWFRCFFMVWWTLWRCWWVWVDLYSWIYFTSIYVRICGSIWFIFHGWRAWWRKVLVGVGRVVFCYVLLICIEQNVRIERDCHVSKWSTCLFSLCVGTERKNRYLFTYCFWILIYTSDEF